VDKRKLSQEPSSSSSSALGSEGGGANATGRVTLETLYQLAASYFTDRESTLRRLHHLQIASTAIRVRVCALLLCVCVCVCACVCAYSEI